MPATNAANDFREPTIVAIDWSGAVARSTQRQAICTAVARDEKVDVSDGRTRDETVAFVGSLVAPVVVGFDFSFSVPAWFARSLGCATIADVWNAAARDGESWLRVCQPPFWGRGTRARCDLEPASRFRACEERLRHAGLPAKSLFQLVGNGQVGAGSVRGMPLLAGLRKAGFAIWPFDAAGPRTVMEIYPTALRRTYSGPSHRYASNHARDATISALVMWEHRQRLQSLPAATDPVTRLEGDVWTP
jgi:hypothetical protein